MARSVSPPVSWVTSDSDALEHEVSAYIQRHGIVAFMDEYYNLLGTRPRAEFTTDNRALARALGLSVREAALPLALQREQVEELV